MTRSLRTLIATRAFSSAFGQWGHVQRAFRGSGRATAGAAAAASTSCTMMTLSLGGCDNLPMRRNLPRNPDPCLEDDPILGTLFIREEP